MVMIFCYNPHEATFCAIKNTLDEIASQVEGEERETVTKYIHGKKTQWGTPNKDPVLCLRQKGMLGYLAYSVDRLRSKGVPAKSPVVVIPWVNNTREGESLPVYVSVHNTRYEGATKTSFDRLKGERNLDVTYAGVPFTIRKIIAAS
ncbi:hypothetical protein HY450_03810 [Candidatus Pacearchaeota archaeon]|nr:hypothetical protein [Candidatus Pacearchaeota archaeon]